MTTTQFEKNNAIVCYNSIHIEFPPSILDKPQTKRCLDPLSVPGAGVIQELHLHADLTAI